MEDFHSKDLKKIRKELSEGHYFAYDNISDNALADTYTQYCEIFHAAAWISDCDETIAEFIKWATAAPLERAILKGTDTKPLEIGLAWLRFFTLYLEKLEKLSQKERDVVNTFLVYSSQLDFFEEPVK